MERSIRIDATENFNQIVLEAMKEQKNSAQNADEYYFRSNQIVQRKSREARYRPKSAFLSL